MTTNKKRLFEFISLSLLLGLAAAIGTIVFFGWLADEVLDGETRQFDEVTRAAVHQPSRSVSDQNVCMCYWAESKKFVRFEPLSVRTTTVKLLSGR